MATLFIQTTDYGAVRAALDLSIDEVLLPDGLIEQKIWLDAAEEEVKRRDPGYASRGAVELQHLKNAAIYLLAARIAPSIPDIISERRGQGYQYNREPVNWPAREAKLKADADKEFAAVFSVVNPDATVLTWFDSAPGGRGE
jgi:hypothetical protein